MGCVDCVEHLRYYCKFNLILILTKYMISMIVRPINGDKAVRHVGQEPSILGQKRQLSVSFELESHIHGYIKEKSRRKSPPRANR